MTKPTTRFGFLVLVIGLLTAVPGSASAAGLVVSVAFSGSGFSGAFTYEQSHQVSSTPGKFAFLDSPDTHSIYYVIGTEVPVSASGTSCDPYTIYTSANTGSTFQVIATTPAGNTVTITINSMPAPALNPRHLPYATAFPPQPTGTTATFVVTNGATTLYSGTITAIIASEQ